MAEYAPLLGAGVFGVLAWVIGFLLNAMRNDRIDFAKERAGLGKEIDDAEERADKASARAERLQGLLDGANEERRKSLDLASEQARAAAARAEELASLREKFDDQAAEVTRLRELGP